MSATWPRWCWRAIQRPSFVSAGPVIPGAAPLTAPPRPAFLPSGLAPPTGLFSPAPKGRIGRITYNYLLAPPFTKPRPRHALFKTFSARVSSTLEGQRAQPDQDVLSVRCSRGAVSGAQGQVRRDCPSRTPGSPGCSFGCGPLLPARGLGSTLASVPKVDRDERVRVL